MKRFLIIISFTLPLATMAQNLGNYQINPPAQIQAQTVNYFDNINTDDNDLGNDSSEPAQQQAENKAPLAGIGSSSEPDPPCADCEKVKQALKAAHASSGGFQHKTPFSFKKWSRVFSGKMHMKMRRSYNHSRKAKGGTALCFNWH